MFSADEHGALIASFLEAATRFWKSLAREAPKLDPVPVALSGTWEGAPVDERCECVIQTRAFQRVLLFPDAGGAERLAEAALLGKSLDVARWEVTFDEEPKWVIKALQAAYDLERAPIPGNVGQGNWLPADPRVVAALSALLDAASRLDASNRTPEGRFDSGGGDQLVIRFLV